jgi:hypothetical protein
MGRLRIIFASRGHKILAGSAAEDEYMTAFHGAIFQFTLPILQFDSRIFRSYPLSSGYSICLRYSYIWD